MTLFDSFAIFNKTTLLTKWQTPEKEWKWLLWTEWNPASTHCILSLYSNVCPCLHLDINYLYYANFYIHLKKLFWPKPAHQIWSVSPPPPPTNRDSNKYGHNEYAAAALFPRPILTVVQTMCAVNQVALGFIIIMQLLSWHQLNN